MLASGPAHRKHQSLTEQLSALPSTAKCSRSLLSGGLSNSRNRPRSPHTFQITNAKGAAPAEGYTGGRAQESSTEPLTSRTTVDPRGGGLVGVAGRTTHRTASSPTRSACPCCGTGRPAPRRAAGRCSRTWPGSEGRRAGGLTTELDARRTRLLYPPARGSTHRGPPGSGRGRPCVRLPPGGHRGRDASRPP